jgi:CheY-like chemotaxis protein
MEPLQGIPVLVVEPHATTRRILAETLNGWGMLASAASDAPAARGEFKLVLADSQVRGSISGWPCPVIALQSYLERRDGPLQPRPSGVAACLTKPVCRAELRAAVLAALGGPAPEAAPRQAAAIAAAPPTHPLRILLAEDNAVNQRVARALLERRGHTVTVAGNGREAVRLAGERDFDVVLMDVQMPEMDGLEATAALRAGEVGSGRRLPIVAMTAHAMKGDAERCLEAGMDAYVSKPIKPDLLFAAIETVRSAAVQNVG